RELALAGGDAVARLHAAGGYKQPTRAQAEEIARVLTLRAAALTERGVDREAAMDDMRDTAARVVGVVLGDAPSSINLN
ncbi:MAG TPA: hypothetical protein VK689_02860, partial [Armatimonadota bacterium]|nr:hypothetical protein [Armatimonadota bacterium]